RDPELLAKELLRCGRRASPHVVDFQREFGGLAWWDGENLAVAFDPLEEDPDNPFAADASLVPIGAVGGEGTDERYMTELGEVVGNCGVHATSIEMHIKQLAMCTAVDSPRPAQVTIRPPLG